MLLKLKKSVETDLNKIKEEYKELTQNLSTYPKGTLVKKNINGGNYCYLAYREGDKVKTKYIKKANKNKIVGEINKRKNLQKKIKDIKIEKTKIEAVLKTINKTLGNKKHVLDLESIKGLISPILKDNHIEQAGIFGSFAKGKQTLKSDVDILVKLSNENDLLDFIGIKQQLQKILKRKVDLVEYDSLKKIIKDQILKEEVRLF